MISESQERMVAVVRCDMVEAVETVCARWELQFARIGRVTDTGDLRASFHGETVGEPRHNATDECPRYEVERNRASIRPRLAQAVAQRAERGEQALDLPPVRLPRRPAPCAARGWTPP